MVRAETIIAVENVSESSRFYQKLLGCRGTHGGEYFEILKDDDVVVLCLHKWGEHEHPTMVDSGKTAGNGLILFFRVKDLEQIFDNAQRLGANVVRDIHFNENSLKNQFSMRDPDDYYIIISE